ncbi:dynamin family protein [Epibacterium ulvae]|uniref:dynamin family protein n=1 Tax=Epibacterium ulvae TaxID=1156985 RepID=UPI001BFC3A10|nr:dynamin family protein [Epibacterium ulvae]MBT8155675.1 dynamin family protein [Epibacterium ulvae]
MPVTQPTGRKPRLALMGEFSAGKSTLTHLLVGLEPLPVQVTATRLPPVWISHGPAAATVVGLDGREEQIAVEQIIDVPLDSTALIRLSLPAEALELCDLIDMPGISDPNMPAEVWRALMPEVDAVIWCTHATQAWRQSEAAAWDSIRDGLSGPSTLLVTHFDKLQNDRDQARVLKRVVREAGEKFQSVFPIALNQALAAGDDAEIWQASGADAFVESLIELLVRWNDPKTQSPECAAEPSKAEMLAREAARDRGKTQTPQPESLVEGRVVPRRVKRERRSERPDRSAATAARRAPMVPR